MCAPRRIPMRDMTFSYVLHDSTTYATWRIRVCFDSFLCVTRLLHMCDLSACVCVCVYMSVRTCARVSAISKFVECVEGSERVAANVSVRVWCVFLSTRVFVCVCFCVFRCVCSDITRCSLPVGKMLDCTSHMHTHTQLPTYLQHTQFGHLKNTARRMPMGPRFRQSWALQQPTTGMLWMPVLVWHHLHHYPRTFPGPYCFHPPHPPWPQKDARSTLSCVCARVIALATTVSSSLPILSECQREHCWYYCWRKRWRRCCWRCRLWHSER